MTMAILVAMPFHPNLSWAFCAPEVAAVVATAPIADPAMLTGSMSLSVRLTKEIALPGPQSSAECAQIY